MAPVLWKQLPALGVPGPRHPYRCVHVPCKQRFRNAGFTFCSYVPCLKFLSWPLIVSLSYWVTVSFQFPFPCALSCSSWAHSSKVLECSWTWSFKWFCCDLHLASNVDLCHLDSLRTEDKHNTHNSALHIPVWSLNSWFRMGLMFRKIAFVYFYVIYFITNLSCAVSFTLNCISILLLFVLWNWEIKITNF